MPEDASKNILPRWIESRKFAHNGVVLRGNAPVAGFSRLADACVSVKSIEAELVFSIGEGRERLVTGWTTAIVERECQRCLKPVETQVQANVSLGIVRGEDEADILPSDFEPWLVVEEASDLHGMLEDEILLSMPIVASHEYNCVDEKLFRYGPEPSSDAEEAKNPFQVLEQLKAPSKK